MRPLICYPPVTTWTDLLWLVGLTGAALAWLLWAPRKGAR